MSSAPGYLRYWGKAQEQMEGPSFHLLAFHSLDVAAVGQILLASDPVLLPRLARLSGCSEESLQRVVPFLLGLHDLGKFSESFQDMREDLVARLQGERRPPRASPIRHDSLGYQLWRGWGEVRRHEVEQQLFGRLHRLVTPAGVMAERDAARLLQPWMAAVLGHHGRPPAEGALPFDIFKIHPVSGAALSRRDAAAFAEDLAALLQPGPLTIAAEDFDAIDVQFRRASWWLAGFSILCDWIGSDTRYFRYEIESWPLSQYWDLALGRARKALAASGLLGSSPRPFAGMGALFPAIAARPSPLQEAATTIELGTGPQLLVLEDLTGSGKTEAALVLSHRLMSRELADGIFFALPTMATANAMHGRVQPLVHQLFDGTPNYLLTHSGPRLTEQDKLALANGPARDAYGSRSSESHETASRTASQWLSDGRKKAFLADLGIGTIDQALLAALQNKHAALRLFGLHRRVLVVDEVHACDAYMLEILCALLRLHAGLGGSAILLSATLPMTQRRRLVEAFGQGLGTRCERLPASSEYPLLTHFQSLSTHEIPVAPRVNSARSLPIRFHRNQEGVVERLIEAAGQGLCSVWIRNSVADALEGHDALVPLLGADRVQLFHARFALGDRLRIEQAVLDRFGRDGRPEGRKGRVLVATQVVEQSLDVDFDVLVTDLAPIDLIIQRAGRLQRHPDRHPRRPAPILEVFAPPWSLEPDADWLGGPFRRTARVYEDPGVLWRTAGELERRGRLSVPDEARALVEAVFGEEAATVPPALERRSLLAEGSTRSHASVAQMATLRLDEGYLRTGTDWSGEARAPTRLGEPTTTLRLARLEGTTPRPWHTGLEPRFHWPMSQLSIARRLVSEPDPVDATLRKKLEDSQPYVGDDVVTVVLRGSGGGPWTGRAMAERTRAGLTSAVPVLLSYSEQRGLHVQREEKS